jgi:hypothetical protein
MNSDVMSVNFDLLPVVDRCCFDHIDPTGQNRSLQWESLPQEKAEFAGREVKIPHTVFFQMANGRGFGSPLTIRVVFPSKRFAKKFGRCRHAAQGCQNLLDLIQRYPADVAKIRQTIRKEKKRMGGTEEIDRMRTLAENDFRCVFHGAENGISNHAIDQIVHRIVKMIVKEESVHSVDQLLMSLLVRSGSDPRVFWGLFMMFFNDLNG